MGEAQKSSSPRGRTSQGGRAEPGGLSRNERKPGCPGAGLGRELCPSIRLPWPWDKSNPEGKGEKVSEGELGGEKRERKGSTRERKSQIKGRNSSEITELFIFPAASGDFFSLFFPL